MFARLHSCILLVVAVSTLSAVAAPLPGNTVTVGDNFGQPSSSSSNTAGSSSTGSNTPSSNTSSNTSGSNTSTSNSSGSGTTSGTTNTGSPFSGFRSNALAATSADDGSSDNNNNSGNIQNGDNVNFGISNSNDVSGLYNVGSGTFGVSDSNISGNTQTKRQDVTGDNNNNAAGGVIQNGDSTTFGLDGSDNVSGVFNVGHNNILGLDGSTVEGNTETSAGTKRQTTDGDNNSNEGDIFNGDATTFGINGTTDASGLFNVGAGNTFDLDSSDFTRNSETSQ